ncbi:MAG: ankyrin repeat domain-containing protein, partial [Campylobacteraceae bacterium]|nr:ankyrin repeat domain-containing protein [Campylobacteraceae bacterium]
MNDSSDYTILRAKLLSIFLGIVSPMIAVYYAITKYVEKWKANHGFTGLVDAVGEGAMYYLLCVVCSFVASYVIAFVIYYLLPAFFSALVAFFSALKDYKIKRAHNLKLKQRKNEERKYYTSLDLSTVTDFGLGKLKNYEEYNKKIKIEEILHRINLENKEIIDCLYYLVVRGVDVNHKDKNGNTILHKAAESGNIQVIDFLLQNGADIEHKNRNKETSLLVAAINLQGDSVEYLLKKGAKLDTNNIEEIRKITQVLFDYTYKNIADAVTNSDIKAIEFLLSNGADIEALDEFGHTGLMIAVKNGSTEIAKELIKKGANDKVLDENNRNLLHLAAYNNHKDLLKLFLEMGQTFDINNIEDIQNITKTLFGTPYKNIADAVTNSDIKAIEFLLSNGADIEALDEFGTPAIIIATKNNNLDLVELLIHNGASNKNKDINNITASIWAAYKGYIEILDFLSDKNALFQKAIDKIELLGYEKISLYITNISVNQLGALLTYKTMYKDHFDWNSKLDEIKKILQLKDIKLIDSHNSEYLIQVYGNSNEASMIKNLLVNSRKPEFIRIDENTYKTCILFKNISGTTLEHWNEQKNYIEDELEIPVEIEEYDQSHTLYPKYGTEKFILIIESTISAMPKLLNIGGKYLKTENIDGIEHIYFQGVQDVQKWIDNKTEIIKFIGKRVGIQVSGNTIALKEKIEESIPKLLELKDRRGNYPKLEKVKEDGENRIYFYTFIPELDLREWKDRSKKTNFKTLFNEPDRVYKLDIYDKTNKELYAESFSTKQYIVLYEYAKIPSKDELKSCNTMDELNKDNIFWGYGVGSSKYYTKINDLSHMMIIGASGSGKSNFINGVILSLLHSIDKIQKMYLVDLKNGIEFNRYKDLNSEKLDVFGKGTKPSKLLAALHEVEAEMYLREEYMANNGITKLDKDPIFLIIDEYAQIDLMYARGEELRVKDEILDTLVKIGARARSANIKLIVQNQDPRVVPDKLKVHLMSRALLKTGKEMDREF